MDNGIWTFINISQGVLLVVLAIAVASKGTFGRKLTPWLLGLIGALLIATTIYVDWCRYIDGLAGVSLIMIAFVMSGKGTFAQKMLPWLWGSVRVILTLLATVYILRSFLSPDIANAWIGTSKEVLLRGARDILRLLFLLPYLRDTVWSLPEGLLLYVLIALLPSKAAPEPISEKIG